MKLGNRPKKWDTLFKTIDLAHIPKINVDFHIVSKALNSVKLYTVMNGRMLVKIF